jgi:hypothetical protein
MHTRVALYGMGKELRQTFKKLAVRWMELAQDYVQRQTLVLVLNIRVLKSDRQIS